MTDIRFISLFLYRTFLQNKTVELFAFQSQKNREDCSQTLYSGRKEWLYHLISWFATSVYIKSNLGNNKKPKMQPKTENSDWLSSVWIIDDQSDFSVTYVFGFIFGFLLLTNPPALNCICRVSFALKMV